VLAAVARTFPDEDPAAVLAVLDRYGTGRLERERERVQLAILTLSRGSLERLVHYTERARRDYRDVLYWAEYLRHEQRLPRSDAG